MRYKDFLDIFLKELPKYFDESYEVAIVTDRRDDKILDTLIILNESKGIHQRIRLFSVYQKYKDRISAAKLAEFFALAVKTGSNQSVSFEPSTVIWQLVGPKEYSLHLGHLPTIPYFDMLITFAFLMDGDAKANLRMDINKNSLKESGLSIEELMELAKENTYRFYKPFAMPLYNYIKEHMIKDMSVPEDKVPEVLETVGIMEATTVKDVIYIISCENFNYGATAILNSTFLQDTADRFQSDLVLLPLSHKGFLMQLLNVDTDISYLKYAAEICVGNSTQDLLTKNIYCYRKDTGTLELLKEV